MNSKLFFLTICVTITINLTAQNTKNFLGKYRIYANCVVEGYYEGDYTYDIDIEESSEENSDIQFYLDEHEFWNYVQAKAVNDSVFNIPPQQQQKLSGFVVYFSGSGSIKKDSIFMQYRTTVSGAYGVFLCNCKGIRKKEYQYIPFPTENAVWGEEQHYTEMPPVYARYILTGEDVVINELTYKKIYQFSGREFDKNTAQYIGGLREDNQKRVYFHEPRDSAMPGSGIVVPELLAYDFGAEKGDTLVVDYQLEYFFVGDPRPKDSLIVIGVDTVEIGGQMRRRMFLEWYTHLIYDERYIIADSIEWVEGIGNINNSLLRNLPTQVMGTRDYLICLTQNDEVIYKNPSYSDCYPDFANIQEHQKEEHDISLCPNPAKEKITFRFSESGIKQIKIYDIKGTLIDTIEVLNNAMEVEYKTSNYKKGVYLYSVRNNKNQEARGRFIVL